MQNNTKLEKAYEDVNDNEPHSTGHLGGEGGGELVGDTQPLFLC